MFVTLLRTFLLTSLQYLLDEWKPYIVNQLINIDTTYWETKHSVSTLNVCKETEP